MNKCVCLSQTATYSFKLQVQRVIRKLMPCTIHKTDPTSYLALVSATLYTVWHADSIKPIGYTYISSSFCTGIQKLSSILKDMTSLSSHCEEVEMRSHTLPKSHSNSTSQTKYDDYEGGVASSFVAMEENPAYQSVDVAAAKP